MGRTSLLEREQVRRCLALPFAGLRSWMNGSWAVLFSHPDDFACYGFEFDRWLEEVRVAFDSARVRPLAVQPAIQTGYSWICEVGGALVGRPAGWLLGGLCRLLATGSSSASRSGSRFVVVLDELMLPRRTFRYEPNGKLPSPIDFAAATGVLRGAAATAAAAPPSP